jgi:hypothetical protein
MDSCLSVRSFVTSYKLPGKVAVSVDVSEHFLLPDSGDTINVLFGGSLNMTQVVCILFDGANVPSVDNKM